MNCSSKTVLFLAGMVTLVVLLAGCDTSSRGLTEEHVRLIKEVSREVASDMLKEDDHVFGDIFTGKIFTQGITLVNKHNDIIGMFSQCDEGQPNLAIYGKGSDGKKFVSLSIDEGGHPNMMIKSDEKSVFIAFMDDFDTPHILIYNSDGDLVDAFPVNY